ncbi:gamma-taxilin [Procambarus clarkii]|uniref:gamma-taxilin n=1 Tax=Procambarus clarkii TaxID=6728 RepID=UPI001E677772|nr:gamma-taxilin-like [Procambarus clarkii]
MPDGETSQCVETTRVSNKGIPNQGNCPAASKPSADESKEEGCDEANGIVLLEDGNYTSKQDCTSDNDNIAKECDNLLSEKDVPSGDFGNSAQSLNSTAQTTKESHIKVKETNMAETKHNRQQKKDKKRKDRDSGVEAISAALKALPAEQQVSTLLAKYAELAEDNRHLQGSVKSVERQLQVLQKEKDQMESEHTKVILTKSRLESLCRELQRQNKVIKDENLTRLREEEERRKEVSAKFNTTLSEISNLMKENADKNTQLRDENQDMAGRLQELIKQYEERESHVDKMLQQKDLQCQLLEAKMAKQQIEVTEDKEKMLIEKKGLLEEVASYQHKTQQMSMNEISLRTQLNSYMEKYEDFQNTLDKSNKIFNTFKKEMDEMTKKIKRLEKETKTWKERWEGANKALLNMVGERAELEKHLDTQTKQNVQLQNLCRALQQQLTELRIKDKASQAENNTKSQKGTLNESKEEKKVTLKPVTTESTKAEDEDSSTSITVNHNPAEEDPVAFVALTDESPAEAMEEEIIVKPVKEKAEPLVSNNFDEVD